jgi:hypothetical protein
MVEYVYAGANLTSSSFLIMPNIEVIRSFPLSTQ